MAHAAPRRGSFSSFGTASTLPSKKYDSRPTSLAELPGLAIQPLSVHSVAVDAANQVQRRMRRMSFSEEDGEGIELPPVDGGRGAWTFVAVGFVMEVFIWGLSYSYPALLVYMQTNDPWQKSSLASLSAIGSVLNALEYFLPVVVIMFFKRYPEWRRTTLAIAAVVNSGGILGAAWATTPTQLLALMGVLGGASGAVLYAPVLTYLNDWWQDRRGLASGLVFSGTAIGGAAIPFLIEHLLSNYGWKAMCYTWAAMSFVVYGTAVFTLKPRVPTRKPPAGMRPPWFSLPLESLLEPSAVAMFISTFLFSLPYFAVSFYLPTYTLKLANTFTSTLVVSIFNLAASVGSLLTGWASDRNLPLTYSTMGIVSGVVAFTAWGYATTLGAVFAFAVLFAMPSAIYSCWGVGARDAAGLNPHLSTFFVCLFGAARGIASLVGPFVASSLYDPKEADERPAWGRFGFSRIIIFAGTVSLVSAFGGVGLWYAKKWKVEQKRKMEEVR
ncbi:hypothetical protein JCM11251_001739 [Rhodosporidiobolus azoricus]